LRVTPQPSGAGVRVAGVAPDSDAARKGLRPGDVIVQAGARPVRTPDDLFRAADAARSSGHKSVLLLIALRFSLPGPAYPALGLVAAGVLWFGTARLEARAVRPVAAVPTPAGAVSTRRRSVAPVRQFSTRGFLDPGTRRTGFGARLPGCCVFSSQLVGSSREATVRK